MIEVKIIEEWDLNLREDACLLEEDTDFKVSHSNHAKVYRAHEAHANIDMVVEKLADECDAEAIVGLSEVECNALFLLSIYFIEFSVFFLYFI